LKISFISRTTRGDVVVAPEGALGMSSLVSYVLIFLGLGVVVPEGADLIAQPSFALLDILDEDVLGNGAVVGPAPTTGGYGALASQGQLLAAVTHSRVMCAGYHL
jgi:hypothetical protein